MKENETTVTVDENGRYHWYFETEEINALRAKAEAIEAVQSIHLKALVTAEGERKVRLQRIIEDNNTEYDTICAEYYEMIRKFRAGK